MPVQSMDELYTQIGGMGRFQIRTIILISLCQIPLGWGLLQMSFSGIIPKFSCYQHDPNMTLEAKTHNSYSNASFEKIESSNISSNDASEVCSLNGKKCDEYIFDSSKVTIVTEWNLVCDFRWVKSVIIMVQMIGVFVGTLVAGHTSNTFGRWKTMYSILACEVVLGIVAAFSVSWPMYACVLFVFGALMGGKVVVVGTYQIEFLPPQWRPLVGVIPTFSLGIAFFAGFAALLENWSHLHLICAALSLVALIAGIFVTESPRWLAVEGNTSQSYKVVKKIARENKIQLPEDTLQLLTSMKSKKTQKTDEEKPKEYTYIDLFRTRPSCIKSLIFFFYWFCMSAMYYGISFGVGGLSGNLYLNIFLLGTIEAPVQVIIFYLSNRFGRRWTSIGFLTLTGLSLLGCLSFGVSSSSQRTVAINALSIMGKVFASCSWCSIQIWSIESFPTINRSLAYGFCCLGARFGGIAAPFVINLEDRMTLSYAICCSMVGVGIGLAFTIAETKGQILKDDVDESPDYEISNQNKNSVLAAFPLKEKV